MADFNYKKSIKTFFCGLAMGAADVVPGISGGTIAFITGIYQDLLQAIQSVDTKFIKLFFRGKFKEAFAQIPWAFLIPLFLGILTAIFSLAKLIVYLLAEQALLVWSFFFGLIIASVVILYKELPEKTLKSFILFLIGTLIGWYVSVLTPVETPNTPLFLLFAGAIAICAMILPGISGSFLLVIMGKYETILRAVTEFDLSTLSLFAVGALCGILSFVRILNFALKHFYSITIALLLGIMFGSLRRIIGSLPPLELNFSLLIALLCAIIGVAVPLALQKLAEK